MSLAGWDVGEIIVGQGAGATRGNLPRDAANIEFQRFIRNFQEGNNFPYRSQLIQNLTLQRLYLEVDLEDLANWKLSNGDADGTLANMIRSAPNEFLPIFEEAALAVAQAQGMIDPELVGFNPAIQVILRSASTTMVAIRNLNSSHIGKVVHVPGIVISATRTMAKPTQMTIRCKKCNAEKTLPIRPGMNTANLPKFCDTPAGEGGRNSCGSNPYFVLAEKSQFVDSQMMKLQESPETIPTGEMPRSTQLSCEKALCDRVVPGTRVTAIGVYSIHGSGVKKRDAGGAAAVAIRYPYLRVLGLRVDTEGAGRTQMLFKPEEEDALKRMSQLSHVRELIYKSIAPAIYGHENIKKAIASLLFGGSRKRLPDGMTLRGDINILLLGDPGTAKSQFLKFVEKVAPVGVYTSGKGSSAAGLTASVIREPGSREFYLEGGAMVMADGGVVCIDEFDKMHTHDRVAIHEAMEQQTISIAKAGITTILNSRTSVLAAANPKFGRYDDMRTPLENIEFQSTILSRFDLIFIVKDVRNEERDRAIASHVVDLHLGGNRRGQAPTANNSAATEFTLPLLKRYIAYARSRCAPRLSKEAAAILADHYVRVRSAMRAREQAGEGSVVPITVRQLEAVVRIAESLAKMTLSPVATEEHVNEAIHLFQVSTLDAASSGVGGAETLSPQMVQQIGTVETLLKRRIAIGSKANLAQVVREFDISHNLPENVVRHAVNILVARDEFGYINQRKRIKRKR